MSITLRAYFFFGVICLVGIVGQWVQPRQTNYWKLLAFAFVIALVVERIIVKKSNLTVKRNLPLKVYLGRAFDYTLTIGNFSPHKIILEGVEAYPENVTADSNAFKLSIPDNEEIGRTLSVTPTALGPLSWEKLHSRIGGLFGMANWNRTLSAKDSVKVVPDHLHLSETKAGSSNPGDLTRRRKGGGLELLGLRDYQPGDPLRAIDWKATARTGKHTVRIFTEEQRLELTLLVDAGRRSALQAGSLTRLGHYVNIAARLAEKTIREGNVVNLICFADGLLASTYHAKGNAGLLRIRGVLERLQSQKTDSNLLPAVFEARKKAYQRNLMVMLTDLDEATSDSQLSKAANMLVPKHVPLIASILDEETAELETRFAHSWIDPYTTIAAHESLLESRRAALHLQRKGAHVVYARPSRLDKEVMACFAHLLERNRL